MSQWNGMVIHAQVHTHTHTHTSFVPCYRKGRPQWGLCCFLSCQLSHGCQQLLLSIRYTHTRSAYTHKHAFFVCLEHWQQGFILCPYILFCDSSWSTTTETGQVVSDEERLRDGLREGDKTGSRNLRYNQQHQGNNNQYVCACTSDQMCTIIRCCLQGRWRFGRF